VLVYGVCLSLPLWLCYAYLLAVCQCDSLIVHHAGLLGARLLADLRGSFVWTSILITHRPPDLLPCPPNSYSRLAVSESQTPRIQASSIFVVVSGAPAFKGTSLLSLVHTASL
jgi:hypothetical protein